MTIPQLEELELLHSNICRSLADPTRIQILYALHEAPCHVTLLAERLDLPQPTVSRHLAVLRHNALVNAERDAQTMVYSLANTTIIDILDEMRRLLRDLLARQADALD